MRIAPSDISEKMTAANSDEDAIVKKRMKSVSEKIRPRIIRVPVIRIMITITVIRIIIKAIISETEAKTEPTSRIIISVEWRIEVAVAVIIIFFGPLVAVFKSFFVAYVKTG